ncbi:MAG: hypothetical protein HZB67_06110, partial [Candidatus Aenigmarchaeota archaeon]|nr:hypothetical protein [Candidatus Aenigmarchaeota archaeon]
MYTEKEQQALEKKLDQLGKFKRREWTKEHFIKLLNEKRIKWIDENLKETKKKYAHLPLEEQAVHILY